MQKIKLSQLKQGQSAIIHSFVEENSEISIKFMEMGFLIETPIQITHIAPFGDPIAVQVLDYSLAIRKEEAEKIWVKAP